MRRPLSPNRWKAAVLAGCAAGLSGSLNLLHQHSPAGLVLIATMSAAIGAMLTISFGLLIRDRRACSKV